jgi:flagellar hook-associated protein 1 FlgK
MVDPFSMLGAAARALDAQRYGLDVTGQNIANVNTPGYARRTITFAEVPPHEPWNAGEGVDVVAVTAARAPLLDGRLRQERPAGARERAIADELAIVESGLGQPGASLDEALSRFYNSYGTLAQNPVSGPARQQVIAEAKGLTTAFRDIAGRLVSARQAADGTIRDLLGQINALASELASINSGLTDAGSFTTESLRDRQSVILGELGDLIDVNVIQRSDGAIDVSIGNGRALVVGAHSYDLSAASTSPDGFASILTDGADVTTDITAEISGGRLAGLLQIRDQFVPGYQNQLDTLAYAVASDVNALTSTGYDLAGNPGLNFFVQPAATAGAARLMEVTPAVAADPRLVVAAAAPSAGNNDVARAVSALQDQPVSGGVARPVDAWGDLIYRIGLDSRSATQAAKSHDEVTQQLETLRDQISGVSLDEEAAWLMRFQRAYEANARFFQVANDTLGLLIDLVRP